MQQTMLKDSLELSIGVSHDSGTANKGLVGSSNVAFAALAPRSGTRRN